MQIEPQITDDLKTGRQEITPPLPQVARIIPFLFYACLVGSVLLSATFFFRLNEATRFRDAWLAEERKSKQDLSKATADRNFLQAKAKRASDISVWAESARPLQPIVVEITRSITPETSISEISFNRSSAEPSQLRFGIKLNGASPAQLDRVLAQFTNRGFRAYSPEQKLARGQIDYQATLLWQPQLMDTESPEEPTP